jgi:hypothetical protein
MHFLCLERFLLRQRWRSNTQYRIRKGGREMDTQNNSQDNSGHSHGAPHIHKLVLGPAPDVSALKERYEPVNCDFTDEIEDLSVRKLPVDVSYWDQTKRLQKACGRITDIFTSPQKEEFLKLDDGTLVRLDKILEVRSN